jgi:RNA polymerase sigma-70 factor (ECF subfamily)
MSHHDWQRWSTHAPSVRAYLRSVEWREDERAEVLSETALAASAVTPRRDDEPGIRSFFIGFAANLLRRRRRAEHQERSLSGHLELVPSPPPDPEATYEHREELAQVWTAIASLPEAQQEMLRLLAIDGLSPSQAAQKLGIPDATARTRLFQARKSLESRLGRRPTGRRTRAAHLLLALALLLLGGAALATVVLPLVRRLVETAPTPVQRSTPSRRSTHGADRPEAPKTAPTPPSRGPLPSPASSPAPTGDRHLQGGLGLPLPPLVAVPEPEETPSGATVEALPARPSRQGRPVQPAPVVRAPRLSTASRGQLREPSAQVDAERYQVALKAHFGHDASAAIAAWSAFLETATGGPLETEARFRRAEARTWLGDWASARDELGALLPTALGTGLEEDIERLLSHAP